ncbi:MAG TPA: hypothetical protein PLZ16_01045 [Gammaproteobacteria bacterium]|nr:hypothetical protein [Gammaproteobacteria bacterium]
MIEKLRAKHPGSWHKRRLYGLFSAFCPLALSAIQALHGVIEI